jgi:phosphoenolpyruvate carboxylase
MSRLIDLGCQIADVHHRYHEIHGAIFGAASLRLIIDALRGRRRRIYREYAEDLADLQQELSRLDPQITALLEERAAKTTEREIRRVLLEYVRALNQAIGRLEFILRKLEKDENAYRDTGVDGRSGFTSDKLDYDHSLLELERLGTWLNRLFTSY